jgi:hypothetical protein
MRPDWGYYGTYDESAHPDLWNGVVGYWAPCLGPTGLRLHDLSRYGNWGTLTNMDAATDWVVNDSFYALDFDGSNDFCELTATPSLTTGTMSCWCKLRSATPTNSFRTSPPFGQDSTNLGSHYTWIDGMIYIEVLRTGRVTATPSSSVNRAAWHLFTIVNDGVRYRLYQNNIQIFDAAATAIRADDFFIGRTRRMPDATYYFDGWVSDAILWSKGLTANEVSSLYQLGRGGMLQRRSRRRGYVQQAGFRGHYATQRNAQLIGGGLR